MGARRVKVQHLVLPLGPDAPAPARAASVALSLLTKVKKDTWADFEAALRDSDPDVLAAMRTLHLSEEHRNLLSAHPGVVRMVASAIVPPPEQPTPTRPTRRAPVKAATALPARTVKVCSACGGISLHASARGRNDSTCRTTPGCPGPLIAARKGAWDSVDGAALAGGAVPRLDGQPKPKASSPLVPAPAGPVQEANEPATTGLEPPAVMEPALVSPQPAPPPAPAPATPDHEPEPDAWWDPTVHDTLSTAGADGWLR